MKSQSIHRQLSKIITYFLFSTLILLLFILFLSNTIFSNLNTLLRSQNLYANYSVLAEDLQDQVTNFLYYPEEISADSLLDQAHALSEVSAEITAAFWDAQFLDHQYLNEAYVSAVCDFLTTPFDSRQELLNAYQNVQHLYEKTIAQYSTTLSIEQQLSYQQMENASARWHEFQFLIIFAFLFVLFITVSDARNLIAQIVSPIETLTNHARYIADGDYKKTEELSTQTFSSLELQTLSDAFLHMSQTIQKQLNELQEKMVLSQKLHRLEVENMTTQVMLSKTEISLMQSLINPHFLFNCLSMLSGLAVIEKAPKVRDYALQIAQFLRTSLNYVGKQVSLKEEFAYIQHYIDIQKLRFGNRISFEVQCDPDCESAVIPAIILQPLVENALIHGVGSYLKDGKILLLAMRTSDTIVLSVEDNGVGMSPDLLKDLESKLHVPFEVGKKGTGLPSVVYRLRYFFHDDVQFHLESDSQHTAVIISIPFQKNKTS